MKTIAVFDKPKSCASCPFLDMGYALDMCRLSKRQVTSYESVDIPKWCELKPLPHKLQADWYTEGYKEGFNACLDDITGDDE